MGLLTDGSLRYKPGLAAEGFALMTALDGIDGHLARHQPEGTAVRGIVERGQRQGGFGRVDEGKRGRRMLGNG